MEVDANTNLKYICKSKDEETKNHQDDTQLITGFMTELHGSPFCPVSSYMKYVSKLHPGCEFLWQQPKSDITDKDIWYKRNAKVGPNPLSTFMSRMSHDTNLTRVYTNHSIRSTGTTCLA